MADADEKCNWCIGYVDGFRVGPDGIDPDGNRVTEGYREDLINNVEYRSGLCTGEADRIDNLPPDPAHRTHTVQPKPKG